MKKSIKNAFKASNKYSKLTKKHKKTVLKINKNCMHFSTYIIQKLRKTFIFNNFMIYEQGGIRTPDSVVRSHML